jgi:hypothetical protein
MDRVARLRRRARDMDTHATRSGALQRLTSLDGRTRSTEEHHSPFPFFAHRGREEAPAVASLRTRKISIDRLIDGWFLKREIHQTHELDSARQTPVTITPRFQVVAIGRGFFERISLVGGRSSLLPHQARHTVDHHVWLARVVRGWVRQTAGRRIGHGPAGPNLGSSGGTGLYASPTAGRTAGIGASPQSTAATLGRHRHVVRLAAPDCERSQVKARPLARHGHATITIRLRRSGPYEARSGRI